MSSSVSRYVIDTCLPLLVRHLFMCFVGVVFVETVGHTLCVLFRNAAGFWWRTHSCAITRQTSTDRTWPLLYWVESGESLSFSLRVSKNMVPRGLEPRIFRLMTERSNQLSYETT